MIKETIDAVRDAELKAQKTITDAEEKAQTKKNRIKSEIQEYRIDAMNKAKDDADTAMKSTVDRCSVYENQIGVEINKKSAILKAEADSRMDKAVDEIIKALI